MKTRNALLTATLSALAMSLVVLIVLPSIRSGDQKMGARAFTEHKMRRLGYSIAGFYEREGRWPDLVIWDQELKPYLDHPRLFPDGEVTDGWENQLRFILVTNSGRSYPILQSDGPNGSDDGGNLDDFILVFEGLDGSFLEVYPDSRTVSY